MDAGFQPVKSADRTLDVLEALSAYDGPQSLGDLTRALDIPKSSLHGILRTMVHRGWVESDGTGTRFRLGLRAVQVGASYVDGDDAVARFAGVLDTLAVRFGETVHYGRLSGPDVTYLAKRESVHPLRLYSAIGRRLPAHATALGKALLARRSDAIVDDLLNWPLPALTGNTITDRAALHAELALIRSQGWAADRQENTVGIACFAVAVGPASPGLRSGGSEATGATREGGASGGPTATASGASAFSSVPDGFSEDAISVSIPTARLTTDLEGRVIGALLEISGAA